MVMTRAGVLAATLFVSLRLRGVSSFTAPCPGHLSCNLRVDDVTATFEGKRGGGRGRARRVLRAKGDVGEEKQESQDIVEKLFSMFFGQKEDAPANLKRMTVKSFPDQYPAEKVLQAEPVPGDSKDIAVIRPLLKQTDLEYRKLKLVYDAKKNGWKPAAFHKGVDFKGPGIVVAKTKGGAVVGGYNPKGWVGYGEYRPGISAFLFTWRDGDTSKPAIKLRKIGGAGLAVWDRPESGPLFGSEGFGVGLLKGSERLGRSKLGIYYERLPGGVNSIFSPNDNGGMAELVDLRAYVGVYEKGETIPFDDAIPLSIT